MTKFNTLISLILLALLTVACSKDTATNFTLKGHIKGLKKGIVYLQKDGDTSIVNLDSLVIKGQKEFTLHTTIEEPVILYLKLFKNDGEEHYIPFFADKGTTEIETSLKSFNFDSKIKGSKQQALLDEYSSIMTQYKNQNLDIIEASFLSQKNNKVSITDSLMKRSEILLKRTYSYTIQFALNNNDSEVAPYLALYKIPNANPIYMDSIYNRLTENVKNSFYGKKLNTYMASRKIED